MVRTRIAPSPTGYPHIGTVYQALFDWAYARKHDGKFIVRIEDTDQTRLVADAEEKIFSSIDWFGLSEDESVRKGGPFEPYRQSERLEIYNKYAKELVEKGVAYYCDCTPERLKEVRDLMQKEGKNPMYDKHCRELGKTSGVIRLKVPESTTIVVMDGIRGEISFESSSVDDQVLIKSDGFPTYHLAVVVDDHTMEITDVVRGEEWLTSTPKHWLLYDFFGWTRPNFYHTPVLRNPDKSKLSKRHGHTSVEWYKEAGFLPEAILNFLALMGWSHPEEKEIFSLTEFIELFDLKDLKPVGPIFDLNKLTWMNGMYIRETQNAKLKTQILEFDPSLNEMDDQMLEKFLDIAKSRMKTLKEFRDLIDPFLNKREFELTEEQNNRRAKLREQLQLIDEWSTDKIVESLKSFAEQNDINFKEYYRMLFNEKAGLPLADAFETIGREKTLELVSL